MILMWKIKIYGRIVHFINVQLTRKWENEKMKFDSWRLSKLHQLKNYATCKSFQKENWLSFSMQFPLRFEKFEAMNQCDLDVYLTQPRTASLVWESQENIANCQGFPNHSLNKLDVGR